jgi:Inner membrane protein YgaP-like, transmembrane domain
MKPLFAPNITRAGRLARGFSALVLFVAAGFGFRISVWLGLALLILGIFVAFEALRGWCLLRACGIKTKY